MKRQESPYLGSRGVFQKRLWFLEAHLQGSATITTAVAREQVAVK